VDVGSDREQKVVELNSKVPVRDEGDQEARNFRSKPLGEVAAPLKRRATETVIYPDAFDKL
jgi:hypothetical protein